MKQGYCEWGEGDRLPYWYEVITTVDVADDTGIQSFAFAVREP